MSTRERIDPHHARRDNRGRGRARPGRPERPERPEKQGKQGKSGRPLFSRAFWIVTATMGVFYAMATAALTFFPAALTWQSGKLTAMAFGIAGAEPLPADAAALNYPFQWAIDYLKFQGIMPKREPWMPSGVNYGNTSMKADAQGKRIYMAWHNMPRKLNAVPPGVNVLAPAWFFVEKDGDSAVVNDLAHAGGKTSSWDPVQYVTTAHEGGAQVWGVVQSFKPALTKLIVTDTSCRSEFLSRIVNWVREYKLDGIDFDFENMDPADIDAYTSLVADCKQALPASAVVSVVVTVPLANPDPGNWWQSYDREALGRVADYVAVMTYDKMDLQPLASIGWVSGKVNMLLDMVPAEKLLLGVPFYGEDFQTGVKSGERLSQLPAEMGKSKSSVEITPAVVTALLGKGYYTTKGKKVEVDYWVEKGVWSDEYAMTRYSYVDKNGYLHVLYCDDAQSLLAKGGLTAFERLGGVAVWEAGYGTDPMWKALTEGMAGG